MSIAILAKINIEYDKRAVYTITMSNTSKNKHQKITFVVSIFSLVVAIAALAFVWLVATRLSSDGDLYSTNISRLQSQHAQLQFCYDRQITPCDDASVTSWNDKHADDTFNLKAAR